MRRTRKDPDDAPNSVRLGKCIRTRRELLDMTQLYLAESLSLSPQQIARYETGENDISVVRFWRLARFLEIEPGRLASIAFEHAGKTDYVRAFLDKPAGEDEILAAYRRIVSDEDRREVQRLLRDLASRQA